MTDKERLDKANQILDDMEIAEETRKSIGHDLKEIDKQILEVRTNKEAIQSNPENVLKELNKLFNKCERKIGERSGVNSTLKTLKAELIRVVRGESEYNSTQVTLEEFAQEKK